MDYSTIKTTTRLLGLATMFVVPKMLRSWNPYIRTWIVWTITLIVAFIVSIVGGELATRALTDKITETKKVDIKKDCVGMEYSRFYNRVSQALTQLAKLPNESNPQLIIEDKERSLKFIEANMPSDSLFCKDELETYCKKISDTMKYVKLSCFTEGEQILFSAYVIPQK